VEVMTGGKPNLTLQYHCECQRLGLVCPIWLFALALNQLNTERMPLAQFIDLISGLPAQNSIQVNTLSNPMSKELPAPFVYSVLWVMQLSISSQLIWKWCL
jgi:hypothetical protein